MEYNKKELRQLSKNQLIAIILELKEEIEAIKRCLLAYENPHTPPSKTKKYPPKEESTGKLGAPVGHPKYKRKEPESTCRVEYIEETCPKCSHKLGKPFKTERTLQEEIILK